MKNYELPIFKVSESKSGNNLEEYSYRDIYTDDGRLLEGLYCRKKAGEVLFHCHCNPNPIPMTISSKAGGGGYYIKSYPNRQQEHIDCMFNVNCVEHEEYELLGMENNLPVYRVYLDFPTISEENTQSESCVDDELLEHPSLGLLSFISNSLVPVSEDEQLDQEAEGTASKEWIPEEDRTEQKIKKTPAVELIKTWFLDYWKRRVVESKLPMVLNEGFYSGLLTDAKRYVIKPTGNVRLDSLIGVGLDQDEFNRKVSNIWKRHKAPALILLPVYRLETVEDRLEVVLLNVPTITAGTIKTIKVTIPENLSAGYRDLSIGRSAFIGGIMPASSGGVEVAFGEFVPCADNGLIVRSAYEQELFNRCHNEGRAAYLERQIRKEYGYYGINGVLADTDIPWLLLIFEPGSDVNGIAAQRRKLNDLLGMKGFRVWYWKVADGGAMLGKLPRRSAGY